MSRIWAFGLAAAAILLLPMAMPMHADAGRQLRVSVTVSARTPEPGTTVSVRVRARDQRGRVMKRVKCVFLWHQKLSARRATRFTNRAGAARSTRRVRGLLGGVKVPVTVKCTWRGQTRRVRTWITPLRDLPRVPKIVFLGDSISAGYYATTEARSFRGRVLSRLGSPPTGLIGVHGWDSDDVDLARLASEAGNVVVVEIGTNDAIRESEGVPVFAKNLRAIAAAARSGNPDSRLVFVSVWQPAPLRTAYDKAIVNVAAKYGRHFVDISAINDSERNRGPAGTQTYVGSSDGWHPNDTGHAAIADALSAELDKIMRQNSTSKTLPAGDVRTITLEASHD